MLLKSSTILVLAFALAGCLISSSSHTEYRGKHVGQATLDQIEPGQGQAFVLAVLGEPTSKAPAGENRELWKWSYTEQKTSKGGVFLLVSTKKSTETTGTVYVEFEDGKVARTWRD